jgi:hypothetical protein
MQYDAPPLTISQNPTDCSRDTQSPPPGCDRRNVSTISFQLHLLAQAETDVWVKSKYKDAIASLAEILTAR